jgi:hypothetical protein
VDETATGQSEMGASEAPVRERGPAVARGTILAYRVFDAGDLIALDVAEATVAGAHRVEMGGPLAEGLVIPVRPLEVPLGDCTLEIPRLGRTVEARASAHVYDFGAVSVLYEITIPPGSTFEELTPLCDALYDDEALSTSGVDHRRELVDKLGPSIEKTHGWTEAETYTIVFVEELSGATVSELYRSDAVAKMLLGETSDKPLSRAVRDDVLRNAFSYFEDDLVIVDWNSALVLEPSGSRVVPHVLELATSQLIEFRFYDGLIDQELARVYDHVEKMRPRIWRDPYKRMAREVLRRFMELTEFTERVDNAIKSVGDVYLARVYLSAIRRFRVPEWRESVEAKLALVSRAYDLLKGEVEISRSQLLEIIIIILILVEVVNTFARH